MRLGRFRFERADVPDVHAQSSLPERERAASPASDGAWRAPWRYRRRSGSPDTFWLAMARPIPMSCCAGSCPGVGSGLPGLREVEYTMKTTVVRYQVKPERTAENQEMIEAVFAELEEREPEGFTYKVFRLEDGVSFIHVVIEHDIDEPDSLQAVPAFQAFVAGIADRCDVPPVATGATIVGGYR